jgi:hypothetical protein
MPTVNSDTKLKVTGDLVKREFDQLYCRVNAKVRNVLGGVSTAIADPIGMPVKLNGTIWELIVAADIANATGIIVEGPPIPALADDAYTSDEYAILTRGPAVLDSAQIAATDCNGDAITNATAVAALAGESPPIICVTVPSVSSTQTT